MSKPIDSKKYGQYMAEAFNKWKEENNECFEVPVDKEYLSNRLWWAFNGGMDASEAYFKKELDQQLERNTAIAKDLEYWAQRSADLLKELEAARKQ